jgi:hypothetical protein
MRYKNRPLLCALTVGLVLICGPLWAAQQELTYVNMVKRLTDLEPLATVPAPGEHCAQWSRYDRASRYDAASGKYLGWLASRASLVQERLPSPVTEHKGVHALDVSVEQYSSRYPELVAVSQDTSTCAGPDSRMAKPRLVKVSARAAPVPAAASSAVASARAFSRSRGRKSALIFRALEVRRLASAATRLRDRDRIAFMEHLSFHLQAGAAGAGHSPVWAESTHGHRPAPRRVPRGPSSGVGPHAGDVRAR